MNRLGKLILGAALLLVVQARAGLNQWTSTGPASAVNAVAAHAQIPARLYAAGSDGLYRSPDGGQTWENVRGPLLGRSVLCLAVDPEDGDRLYAGANAGLYLSEDAGSSWAKASQPAAGVLCLAAGPGGRVWAGTFGQGVYRSPDSGRTWEVSTGTMAEAIVFAVAPAPEDADLVYAGTSAGLFLSRDGGRTWTPGGSALQALSVRAITPLPGAGRLLAGTFGEGVFRSEDGGQTWTAINSGLADLAVRSLSAETGSERVFYAATANQGFFRTGDGGQVWRALNTGLPSLTARSVLVHPGQAGRVLGGGAGKGVWVNDQGDQPRLEVERQALDFGEVAVGGQRVLRLRVANTGKALLSLSRLSVGRTPPFAVSPAQFDLAPGAAATAELRFTPVQRGAERDTLKLRSNDPDAPLVAIPLGGSAVEAELSLSADSLDFGPVRLSGFRDTTVVITNKGNTPLALRSATCDSSAFEVLGFSARDLAAGQRLALTLRFRPARIGPIVSRLTVLSNAARNPRLEVPVSGLGRAPVLTASPAGLDFGAGQLQRTKTLTLDLANTGNSDLSIERLGLGGGAFQVAAILPLSLAPGEVRRLRLSFLPLHGGEFFDTLVVASDAATGALRIPLKGSAGGLALRPRTPVPVGSAPQDLVGVDLDGDGNQDLASVDGAAGRVQVLLNDGSGLFPRARQGTYPATEEGAWDEAVALDAAPIFANAADLVVADRIGRSLTILANDGAGRFAGRRQEIFIGRALTDVHAADLDADGDVDLAVADGDAPSITVLYNNGPGSFNVRNTYEVGAGPVALVSANLDEDGHRDLVVANAGAGTLSVLRNNRLGGFQAHQDYTVGGAPGSLALGDQDADGDEDIFAALAAGSRSALLLNDGQGRFTAGASVQMQSVPADLGLADLTSDIFSDLVAVSGERPYGVFWENDGGKGFIARDTLATNSPLRRVALLDLDGDGHHDVAGLSAVAGTVQVFINADTTRRQDQPRPPTLVRAQDASRDLGRRIEVLWQAPDLDERIQRTTQYTIFRAAAAAGPFAELGRAVAGARRFVDISAALGDTFYYYVQAGNSLLQSLPSDTVRALSQPSPFYELEVIDEARLSVGDTLKVKAFVTPAGQALAGLSLYLSYSDSALQLIPLGDAPFRLAPGMGAASVFENRVHRGAAHQLDLSLGNLAIPAGVSPVLLGEVWFRGQGDSLASLAIDDEPERNRRSAVVAAGTGELLLPFIADTTRLAIRDYPLRGRVQPEGYAGRLDSLQVTLSLVNPAGQELQSALNDEDRLRPGIQRTLDAQGEFRLAQVPRGRSQVLVKPPSHLQGQVQGDSVSVGDTLTTRIEFRWLSADSTNSQVLPAGDATGDNQINLADFGLLVRYFGATTRQVEWAQARRSDFNGDGAVNFDDFGLLAQNFGQVGMGARGVVRKMAGSYWMEGDTVRVEAVAGLVGFALSGPGLEIDLKGTAWAGQAPMLQSWTVDGRTVVAAALPANALAREGGDLAVVRAGRVEEVQLLTGEGEVLRLARGTPRPLQSALRANYPNPFNPSTQIPFAVGGAGTAPVPVRLEILDLLGQRVRTVVAGTLAPGNHRAAWDGRDQQGREVAAGVYCYRLQVGDYTQTRRLLLLR
ncbi:MAG: choice-of-anchor D domain-containing protein [Candidatus Latescibacteria bacterium]|nr:choice-of-anchor D domain-containing protein [Candidatus Latescibacterota bacterium]